jgi:hypothetical protein
MMKLFQINLSDADADRVNAGERDLPQYVACCDAMMGDFPGQSFYQHVADIESTDLDYAFYVGNVGPEELIKRYAPMHSVSVGDVLVTEYGVAFMVKPVGFEAVEGWVL